MIRIVSVVLLIAIDTAALAQTPAKLSLGVNFLVPATSTVNKSFGAGVNLAGELYFSDKFSATARAGYLFFKGKITTWDNNEVENFAMLPVLVGGRFYIRHFFTSLETGVAIQANENTGTNLVVSPSIGYKRQRFDIAVYLFGVPQTFASFPENSYFIKGGYSYFGLRANYSRGK